MIGFQWTDSAEGADVVLLNTCAIRDNAELKVWNRLQELKSHKLKVKKQRQVTIGVLGCMAERLKTQLLESDKMVDVVAGPDSYRDLPRLLSMVSEGGTASIVTTEDVVDVVMAL